MYIKAGMPLSLGLYDNNGVKVNTVENGVAAVGAAWRANDVQERSPAVEKHLAASERALDALQAAQQAGLLDYHSKTPEIDWSCAPPSGGLWAGGDDLVSKPRTLYRASVEPVQPKVVFHLDAEGQTPSNGNGIRYDWIAADGANLSAVLADPAGLEAPGIKLMSDGTNFVFYTGDAEVDGPALNVNWSLLQESVAEVLAFVPPKPPLRPVFSWSFSTSRFVTFVHHVHSFIDTAWDRRVLLDRSDRDWGNVTQDL
jgi:hypothetical protein